MWKNAVCWRWNENRPESKMLFILAARTHLILVFNPVELDKQTDGSIGKQKMEVFLEEADVLSHYRLRASTDVTSVSTGHRTIDQ